jgi:2-dehydro-3-deoxygalactonokinase
MIGVDWGTSSFRAYRLRDGVVIGRIETAGGILGIPQGGFAAALRQAIAPWLAAGETEILLCGMVGSRQGWVEASYLPCPAGPAEIAAAAIAIPFDGARVRLLPGLTTRAPGGTPDYAPGGTPDYAPGGTPDVMRGEETKLVGLLATLGTAPALVCLPGTHSKWARLAGGQVVGFTTHMTGELRAVLLDHSILGRQARAAPPDAAAFRRGLHRAAEPGGLSHHLFGTRALGLFGELPETATESYLSGLLIGAECRAEASGAGTVHLAGAEALAERYAIALTAAGQTCQRHPDDIAASGLALLAGRLAAMAG